MKVVYLAGPFRGETAWRIESNVRRAECLSLELWRAGVAVLCPHTNTRFFHGGLPDQVWIDGTLAMLRKVDALFVMPGSEGSEGTKAEVLEAVRLGIPVFEDVDSLVCWLREVR